ncbi:MAG: PEP-CTERM sorting domain-containing protein [Pseudomonadales bacterium]
MHIYLQWSARHTLIGLILTAPSMGFGDIISTGEVYRFEDGLIVGTGVGPGYHEVNGGSLDRARFLSVATEPTPSVGSVLVSGNGSTLLLDGVGQSNHLDLQAGTSNVIVNDGGSIRVVANREDCAPGWCNSFVGNFAGSEATLTISGIGSSATGFFNAFVVGATGVFTEETSGFDAGIMGGTTNAMVNIVDGGLLSTEGISIGQTLSADGDGSEVSNAILNIDGVGSLWTGTSAVLGTGVNATGVLRIINGGTALIQPSTVDGQSSFFIGSSDSTGASQIIVDGSSSQLIVSNTLTTYSIVQNGSLLVTNGGSVSLDNSNLAIGLNEGLGRLSIGDGSVVESDLTIIGPDGFAGNGIASLIGGTIVGDVVVDNNGLLVGTGTIDGNLIDSGGVIGPGFSPGTLAITGNLVGGGGTLELEIGGVEAGLFDQIVVGGFADLADFDVAISFIDDFLPSTGDVINFLVAELITAPFDPSRVSYSGLPEGFEFGFAFSSTGISLVTEKGVPVPEPGTLTMLLFGLIGFFLKRTSESKWRRGWDLNPR